MSETRAGRPTDAWRQLEDAVRQQVRAQLAASENAPLDFGAHVAWSVCARSGPTTGFSPLHRVGDPIGAKPYTVCRESIPAPVLRMTLSPAIVRTMERCGYCEAGIARNAEEAAA